MLLCIAVFLYPCHLISSPDSGTAFVFFASCSPPNATITDIAFANLRGKVYASVAVLQGNMPNDAFMDPDCTGNAYRKSEIADAQAGRLKRSYRWASGN